MTTANGDMKAMRVHAFGGIEAIVGERIPIPEPASDEVLIRVHAAGVGPWDALIRSGNSVLEQPLPLTLGSDVAGVVERVGADVRDLAVGDEVYGVTNPRFVGGYAEHAACKAGMLARKPRNLSFVEAASAPVVAVTAWQMLFDEAKLSAGQTAVILGAAGSVGTYAVALAKAAEVRVIAVGRSDDLEQLRALGADEVLISTDLARCSRTADAAIDLVGGELQSALLRCVRPGGTLVTAVPSSPAEEGRRLGVKAGFMLVHVETRYLNELTARFEAGRIRASVGTTLRLDDARIAHEMLARTRKPAGRGKIVLTV